MFEIPKEKVFHVVKSEVSEDDPKRVMIYMKNSCDEVLLIEAQQVLDAVRQHSPEWYMKGVTKDMINLYT